MNRAPSKIQTSKTHQRLHSDARRHQLPWKPTALALIPHYPRPAPAQRRCLRHACCHPRAVTARAARWRDPGRQGSWRGCQNLAGTWPSRGCICGCARPHTVDSAMTRCCRGCAALEWASLLLPVRVSLHLCMVEICSVRYLKYQWRPLLSPNCPPRQFFFANMNTKGLAIFLVPLVMSCNLHWHSIICKRSLA